MLLFTIDEWLRYLGGPGMRTNYQIYYLGGMLPLAYGVYIGVMGINNRKAGAFSRQLVSSGWIYIILQAGFYVISRFIINEPFFGGGAVSFLNLLNYVVPALFLVGAYKNKNAYEQGT